MDARRRASGVALAAVLLVTAVPARTALAQTVAAPPPTAEEQRNAAIVKPLVEIGRVRARTPYCAALASARPGIDAAIAFEYQAPVVAADLRMFRDDSGLHKHYALKRAEADLTALWKLSVLGRNEVRALRAAAYAEGLDDAKRTEMLALANAVDGAKERQKELSKAIAQVLAVYAEAPVRTVATTAEDELRSASPFGSALARPGRVPPAAQTNVDPNAPISAYAQLHPEAMETHERGQTLFSTFAGERLIRDDMEVASQHAKAAMQLGGCSAT